MRNFVGKGMAKPSVKQPDLSPTVGKARRKKTPGSGRTVGTQNKATVNAREAIARLVDGNAARMQEWLDAIARDEGPMAAWRCLADVIEYHVPKLSRSELTARVNVVETTDQAVIMAEIRELLAADPELRALLS
jgi:hypothetical protein